MIAAKIEADGLRNLRNVSIEPCPGVNILSGDNGQGKTSLLECIWLFSAGASFRTGKLSECVGFDAPAARLSLVCEDRGLVRTATLRLEKEPPKKTLTVDGVPRRFGSDEFTLPALIFRPEDLDLVKAGPAVRRDLMDGVLTQHSPRYRSTLAEYTRCLAQRNALLRTRTPDRDFWDVLDAALSRLGVSLTFARAGLLTRLAPAASRLYEAISGGTETLALSYASGTFPDAPPPTDKTAAELACFDRLTARRQTDLLAGFTTLGAHRDDLDITLDARPARAFASQGQQRTAAISARLACADLLRDAAGTSPLVLLDDVFSELDARRSRFILDSITSCQTFLTGCDPLALRSLAPHSKHFLVSHGSIAEA